MDYTESTMTDVLNGSGTAVLEHLCFSDHPSCQGMYAYEAEINEMK